MIIGSRKLTLGWVLFAGLLLVCLTHGCRRDYVTIERTVNAAWSADGKEILKVISTYETYKPGEPYYNATAGKNWQYRFERCDTTMSNCEEIRIYNDEVMGGTLQYVPVFWFPAANKIAAINIWQKAVLISVSGGTQILEPPADVIREIFKSSGQIYPYGLAPSPDATVMAIYFQTAYLETSTTLIYYQCVSFFDVTSGNHLFTQELPWSGTNVFPKLTPYIPEEGAYYFLWSASGSGVYFVTRDHSYLVQYSGNPGITEVSMVPERAVITNAGRVSDKGLYLKLKMEGNDATIEIVQLENWIAHEALGLIPCTDNTYSFW
jgi:hypothetical protein